MSNEMIIDWAPWKSLVNETFVPLVDNRDRYLILYGGRASSKSDFAAKKLVYRCLTEQYFKCLIIRNEYSTLRESAFQTLRETITDMGLESLFEFNLSPLQITCTNGNRFIARGTDDTTKLKSVKDPTAVWYEEDIPSEEDFITISSSIRTTKALYLQELFTINPEVQGDYTQHWFWKRFFEGRSELSFSGKTTTKVDEFRSIDLKYTVHHSTYKDNRWLPDEYKANMESLRTQNPYYYEIYTLGRWGRKITGGQFFRTFSITGNTGPVTYRPDLALWLSFDFNTQPGVSCGVFQVEGKTLRMIDEIQLPSPRNNTTAVVAEVIRKYPDHAAGVNVTGDASGRHEDTRGVAGWNDYTIIMAGLQRHYNTVRDRTPRLNPPIIVSGNFVNNIFEAGEAGYKGIRIIVGDRCQKMTNDLLYLLESDDGTTLKQKVKDKDTGATYEQYGHFGDLFRYAVCTVFASDFEGAKRGHKTGTSISYGKNNENSSSAAYSGQDSGRRHESKSMSGYT